MPRIASGCSSSWAWCRSFRPGRRAPVTKGSAKLRAFTRRGKTMSRWTVVLCTVLLGAACSNKPKMDLPTYPGAMGMAGGSVSQTEAAMVWNQNLRTPDSAALVRNFYNKELVETRGWKMTGTGAGTSWSNGNMTWTGGGTFGSATADDPTKEGGFVQLVETDRETFIAHWQ